MNRKRLPVVVLAVIAVAAILYFTIFRHRPPANELFSSGTIEATEAALGFQVPGRIQSIVAHEGDHVTAGEELATLDRTELDARRAQAVAQRGAARAMLTELQSGARSEELRQAQEAARAAQNRFADAQRDYERTKRLLEGGAVSQEALDKATLALQVAQSQRDQAQQQLQLVQAGPRPERLTAQRAVVAQSDAAITQVDAALANAVIKAPFDGIVTARDHEPGETVGAGAPVLTIVNLADRWVRIYIREDRIGAVHLAQRATITSDTYPTKRYPGTVSFISTEAEFTPRNVQTAEERVKLVYAVKVRITGDPGNELKTGMPVDVRLALPEATPSDSAPRK